MSQLSVIQGRVCIIKVGEFTTLKNGLDLIKEALVDVALSSDQQYNNLPTFIFIDFSPFNIINSSLVGTLGSLILNPQIKLLGLCGMLPSVTDILQRFGVVASDNLSQSNGPSQIKENLAKVRTFTTINEGLISLNPST